MTESTLKSTIEPALSSFTFRVIKSATSVYNRFNLPVISTGRSFDFYRKVFFNNDSKLAVLDRLRGKLVLDIGCGLTPYVSDSMFQECQRAGVDFYGVDPKLASGFKLGMFDKLKIRLVGGRGQIGSDIEGLAKAIGTMADELPFADESVDLILSSYLLYAWIDDEWLLESIFREFQRVLKPGGKIQIFPTPHMNSLQRQNPGYGEVLSSFEIKQQFAADFLRIAQYPPAYETTFTKR